MVEGSCAISQKDVQDCYLGALAFATVVSTVAEDLPGPPFRNGLRHRSRGRVGENDIGQRPWR
jgi:hypothetical protein